MTVVCIHQPGYLPWLGLIDKVFRSDVFVVMDNVQYNRDSFQHRTLYSTAQGAKYLSLAVKKAGHIQQGLKIRDIELADLRMPCKHFETLRQRYGKTPGWKGLAPALEGVLLDPPGTLLEITMRTLELTLRVLGYGGRVVLASSLDCDGKRGDLVLNLVKEAGGDVYLSGTGAKSYMDDAQFERDGIGVVYQNFTHPTYRQSHNAPFVPGCFALEWALEEGEDAARAGFARHLLETGKVT